MAKRRKKTEVVKFLMYKRDLKKIDRAIERGYYSSREEYPNNAHSLLAWAIATIELGKEVTSYDDDDGSIEEIQFNSKVKPLEPTKKAESKHILPKPTLAIDNTK